MRIMNNMSSIAALGEMKKNDKAFGKAMKKLASGMKLNSAGDGAAEYSISENMRVRLRCLGQDSENVQKGKSMLQVAEGAIQSQINLMRTIKERVINANNDTNTDEDRQIIQKEIDQYYDEINDIAYSTEFNGKKLLVGNAVGEVVSSWDVKDKAVLVEGSDSLNIIPDNFSGLDGQDGDFDTFGTATDGMEYVDGTGTKQTVTHPYDGYNMSIVKPASMDICDKAASSTDELSKLHDAGTPKTNIKELDVSGVLDSTAFTVKYAYQDSYNGNYYSYRKTFVLTNDTTNDYVLSPENNEPVVKIDISGKTYDEIAAAIASSVSSTASIESGKTISNYYNITASGSKVKFETVDGGEITNDTNYFNIYGTELSKISSAMGTGLAPIEVKGGTDSEGHYEDKYNSVTDATESVWVETKPATRGSSDPVDISSVANGTGLLIDKRPVVFLDDASSFQSDAANGYYTVGKNWDGTFSVGDYNVTLSGGKMTIKSRWSGSYYNSIVTSDSISAKTKAVAVDSSKVSQTQEGNDGDRAHWDIDLASYDGSAGHTVEDLIKSIVGKGFYRNNNSSSMYDEVLYEFIDSAATPKLESTTNLCHPYYSTYAWGTSNALDLNEVRNAVAGGKTIAQAFSDYIIGHVGYAKKITDDGTDTGTVTGVKFEADTVGAKGNDQFMVFLEGKPRSYTIDFEKYFTDNGIAGADIPATLHDKGFRFYCATDKSQWVNVHFVNGKQPQEDDRPESGTAGEDIKTLELDVSGVTDVKSLVDLIYGGDANNPDGGLADYLDNTYRHFFTLAADSDAGTVTIYDTRKFFLQGNGNYKDWQTKGAKIADGVLDNVVKDLRNVYVNNLYIHHTDESSNNILVKIPQTSMDHIYGYKTNVRDESYFNVLTRDMREKLLGWDPPGEKGIIDKGIQYLTDAQTLIGAQINHMEFADANITTMAENTTAAESVIRDSDMAKEYCEFSKASILTQTAQSMLAQSNQNAGRAVELLQGV